MPDVDFRTLLDFTSENVIRPKSAPECWLIGVVGQLGGGEIPSTGTPYLYFELNQIEPHPQNPEEILNELTKMDLKKLKSPFRNCLTAEFYMGEADKYKLANALDRVVGQRNRLARERVAEMQNQRVQFKVRPKRDSEGNDLGTNTVLSDTLTLATV